jgi:hypothetical protein
MNNSETKRMTMWTLGAQFGMDIGKRACIDWSGQLLDGRQSGSNHRLRTCESIGTDKSASRQETKH